MGGWWGLAGLRRGGHGEPCAPYFLSPKGDLTIPGSFARWRCLLGVGGDDVGELLR